MSATFTDKSSSSNDTAARRLVFISHANPEENDFTRWLGAQLASAGYEIWSDVVKLIGGEVFWDDIEDAIRNHAAKVVLAVSHASSSKNGVQDEAALAVSIERSKSIPNFVIPIRLDDIDFGDFRANIGRKNAIDFSKSWAAGLAALLKVLERDGVPRGAVGPTDVKAWCDTRFDPSQSPRREDERLISNWLPITELPSHVSMFSMPGIESARVPIVMSGAKFPWFQFHRLVGTFGSEVDFRDHLPSNIDVKLEYTIPTAAFLRGGTRELPGVDWRTARNHALSMIRQAWDRTLEARGLSSFKMANGHRVWFFTKDQVEGNLAHFTDHLGKRRRRTVVGRSERRRVYWHLGFQAKPVLGTTPRLSLKCVILFSEDGKTPLSSVEKMHRLRRGFCRSWWNSHWRDLMLTYVAWLSEDQDAIAVDAGVGATLLLRSAPLAFDSPVAFSDPQTKAEAAAAELEEETPPEEPPELDDGFDPTHDEWAEEGGDDERS